MKKYTRDHEWVEVAGEVATVGISFYAAKELGDITFIELPEIGAAMSQGDILGAVESVKAASDIYSPIGGSVSEVNSGLEDRPEIVNASPEEQGWICKLEDVNPDELDHLMSDAEYEEFTTHDPDGIDNDPMSDDEVRPRRRGRPRKAKAGD